MKEGKDVLMVTDKEAKRMIQEFISDRNMFYPSDIAYDLNLDYTQVCRVLSQLKKEGAIGNLNDEAPDEPECVTT